MTDTPNAKPIHYMPMLLTCEEVQKVEAFIQSLIALRGVASAAVESQSYAASELPSPVAEALDAAVELPAVSLAAPTPPSLAAMELPFLSNANDTGETLPFALAGRRSLEPLS